MGTQHSQLNKGRDFSLIRSAAIAAERITIITISPILSAKGIVCQSRKSLKER
jgi:hypothetical protein